MKINSRAFISYDEPCKFNCKFCYTYGIKRHKIRSIDEMLSDLKDDNFDVLYVSQKNDNFSDVDAGIDLCFRAYERFKSHIFIITRNVFSFKQIEKLLKLKKKMIQNGKHLFFACSLFALESWDKFENELLVPNPDKRMSFLKTLYENEINPILMLRPIFPTNIIPVEEPIEIIRRMKGKVACVVTGELGVNKDVLNRLNINDYDLSYIENKDYLQGAIPCEIKFVDVEFEKKKIVEVCDDIRVPHFAHSMQAINYIINNEIA